MVRVIKGDRMMPISFEKAIVYIEAVFEKVEEKDKKKKK